MTCAHPLNRRLDGGSAYLVPTSFCLDCGATIKLSAAPQLGLALDAPQATPAAPEMPRVISYGGGLDSFAMLLGAIEGAFKVDAVCFIDTGAPGDPGEWPSTYRHLDEVVRPLCEANGIEYVVINHENYPVRDARSLFAWHEARGSMPMAGPGRICTTIAKVERFEKWMDARYPDQDVEVWIGFEAGEEARAAKDPNAGKARKARAGAARRVNRFPLIEWNLCRCRCEDFARRSGHPVPRKSACVFCPYASRSDWQRFAVELPEQFARVVAMEANRPLTKNGKKLSIMDYRNGTPTMLPQYIAKPYTPKTKPCAVCGAADRATKATGCSYLEATP